MTTAMTVGFAIPAFADDDRMAGGRPHARIEAETAEVGGDVFGGRAARRCVGRISRYRLDAKKRKEPIKTCLQIAVDLIENFWQSF